jgi:hypothetical protein
VVGVLVHDAYPRPYERSELPTSSDLLRRTTAALVVASLVAVMLSTAPASAARADDAYHEEDHHHRQQAVRVPKGRGVDRPRLFEVRGRLSGGAERRGRRRGERRRVRFPVSGPPRPRLKGVRWIIMGDDREGVKAAVCGRYLGRMAALRRALPKERGGAGAGESDGQGGQCPTTIFEVKHTGRRTLWPKSSSRSTRSASRRRPRSRRLGRDTFWPTCFTQNLSVAPREDKLKEHAGEAV